MAENNTKRLVPRTTVLRTIADIRPVPKSFTPTSKPIKQFKIYKIAKALTLPQLKELLPAIEELIMKKSILDFKQKELEFYALKSQPTPDAKTAFIVDQ